MSLIPHPIASSAAARPDHVAVVFVSEEGSSRLTYGELCDRVASRASDLAAEGLEQGSRVALTGPVGIDWLVTFHAIGWLGGVVIPASARWTEDEVEKWIRIAAPDFRVAARENENDSDGRTNGMGPRAWPLDETRWEIATSGSSGKPTFCSLTTQQLVFSAMGSAVRLGHHLDDRWLCCLPLNHVGGLAILMRCAWLGTTVVLHPSFSAQAVARAMSDGSTTMVSLVPTMLNAVFESGSLARVSDRLRVVLLGGASASEDLQERATRLGVPLSVTWGMTECGSQLTTTLPGERVPPGDVGPALPFCQVHADADQILTVTGPVAPAMHWRSGDRGRVSAAGRVADVGRADGVIISGGENISPQRVEMILQSHPAVKEVVVVARSDSTWGQRPVAWMVAGDDQIPMEDEFRAWCVQRLMAHEVPMLFRWRDRLPTTELGKPMRAEVQRLEQLESEPKAPL